MHLKYRNVNDAFIGLVQGIFTGQIPTQVTPSRAGELLLVEEPVTITYQHPRERVLFSVARDANPFFHLFEALWMLAGRRDVKPLLQYNRRMKEFSDDGEYLWGAYGHRWRHWFGWDQLTAIAESLRKNPYNRRCVLAMWDAYGGSGGNDFSVGESGGKDVPCNTHVYFLVEDEQYLNMTVCNRSNDLIWGALGANAVHFSFLQEYLAAAIGLETGTYHHFTNNLHVYTERWDPEKWLTGVTGPRTMHSPPKHDQLYLQDSWNSVPLVKDPSVFDTEIRQLINNTNWTRNWEEPFLQRVAHPMLWAFELHKRRAYGSAMDAIKLVAADDWRLAGTLWIERRMENWSRKNDRNPYLKRELPRQTRNKQS